MNYNLDEVGEFRAIIGSAGWHTGDPAKSYYVDVYDSKGRVKRSTVIGAWKTNMRMEDPDKKYEVRIPWEGTPNAKNQEQRDWRIITKDEFDNLMLQWKKKLEEVNEPQPVAAQWILNLIK